MVNLSGAERYLANSTTPILSPTRPWLVLNSNFNYPERPVVMVGTDINGFLLHDCIVNVQSFRVLDTPCGGELCDQQTLFDGEVMMNKCPCFQMRSRVGLAAVVYEILVSLPSGATFRATLSSKRFNLLYIFSDVMPVGIRAAHLEDFEIEDRIYHAASAVTSLINDSGGFMVSGWTKRGEVQDQAVDQPGSGLPHNAPRSMVHAGTLNYHVTRIDPMQPENVDLDILQGLKVDVVTGLRSQDAQG